MLRAVVFGALVGVAPAGAAQAQFLIPGLTFPTMTPEQQNQRVVPYKRALTFCVIKRALADDAAPIAYRDGSFDAYAVSLIDQCPEDRRNLVIVYNQTYGQGQAGPFLNGAYAADLPHAVLRRIRPQLEAKVAELKRTEAAQAARDAEAAAQAKADAEANARQEEAERQRAAAEEEQRAATARAEADRAKAQERAAAQVAEAERLKQVEVAKGAASVLAVKALDCAKDQLKSLVKSGESAEILASAVTTICESDVDHFVEAGAKEYTIENQVGEDDAATGVARAKLRAETHEHFVALAVQAKAGVGGFAPASSN